MKRLAAVFLFLLLLGSLPQRAAYAGSDTPGYQSTACPFRMSSGAECGTLTVPENRAHPANPPRFIHLAVVILKSGEAVPHPDPVIYLSGGPGDSALGEIWGLASSTFRRDRNLIVLEQRGTHFSDPYLGCPELSAAITRNYQRALTNEEEIPSEVEAAVHCRDRLTAKNIDLSAYNSLESAADLKDLRQALGIEQWNLYGFSYGTRLALEAMRTDPQGIRAVLLDSVYPPDYPGYQVHARDAYHALQAVFAACAAQTKCAQSYPDLEDHFVQVVARYNARPLSLSASLGGSQTTTVQLRGDDLMAFLAFGLYRQAYIPLVPFLVEQLYLGNSRVLLPVLAPLVSNVARSFGEGVYYSVECNEAAPFADPKAIEQARQADARFAGYPAFRSDLAICRQWGAGQADPAVYAPVRSDIPTLLLSGQFDPITPPDTARQAAATLSKSTVVVIPAVGHNTLQVPCAGRVARTFLDDPTAPPDTSCLGAVRPPDFITSADLRPTSLLYVLYQSSGTRSGQAGLIALAAAGLLLLIETIFAPLRLGGIIGPPLHRLARWFNRLTLVAGLLDVIFVLGVWFNLRDFTNPLLAGFGVPVSAAPFLWIPPAAAGLALALTGLAAAGWVLRSGSRLRRVEWSFTALAAAGLALRVLLIL